MTGLASLFGGGINEASSAESEEQTASASADTQESAPQSSESTQAEQDIATSQPKGNAQGGGLFSGLASLFGGGSSEPKSESNSDAPVQTSEATSQQSGASVAQVIGNEPVTRPPASASGAGDAEPAPFQKVTRSDGDQVVLVRGTTPTSSMVKPPSTLPSTAARSEQEAATDQVLGGSGSKIRKLLGVASAESSVTAQAPVAAAETPTPDQATTTPLEVAVQNQPSANAENASSTTTAAPAPAATELTASASDTTDGSVTAARALPKIALDEIQTALAAGKVTASDGIQAPSAPQAVVGPVATVDVEGSGGAASGVVMVVTASGGGTGIVLDSSGFILTSWHVVSGQAAASVLLKQSSSRNPSFEQLYSASVVRLSRFSDLALLKLDAPPDNLSAVRFSTSNDLAPGAIVHVIGHPNTGAWTHTIGKVTRVKPRASWYSQARVLHRASVVESKLLDAPGRSGAALFNNRLELIGIGAHWARQKEQLTSVSVETILEFLTEGSSTASIGGASG